MQERGGARWPQPWCIGVVIGVECIVTLTVLAMYQSAKFGQFSEISHSLDMDSHVGVGSSDKASLQEAHRRLLDVQHGLESDSKSFSSLISNSNGIRAALTHKPFECSGTNASATVSRSKEAQRVEHLRCALQRSSSRVGFLLNRKYRDRETINYGLPTKYVAAVEEPDTFESEGKFVSELVESPEWEDSYESDVWSQPGEYIMNLEVGTPPRKLKGIVDTGSDLTWLQCRQCQRCYEQSDPIYEPKDSSTYRELDCAEDKCEELSTSFCNIFTDSCDYMYSYGDNSYTYGTLSTDTFTLRTVTGGQAREFPRVNFGCSHASRGTFSSTRADGVVALGRGALSLASQLGKHFSDRFGYCLVSRRNPTSVTSPIYFGDLAILTGPGAGYTPMLVNERHRAYYYVNMTGISVGERRVDIPAAQFAIASETGKGGTILDSGTTVTNLAGSAYDALVNMLASAVQYPTAYSDTGFDLCFDVGDSSDPQFPRLVFHLDGVDLDLPRDNYLLQAEDRTLCLAVDRSSDNLSVIGNVQQQNFRVLYDRENARIGFQPTICIQE